MSKIVKITKSYQHLTLESYIVAAWNFALLALWPFEKIKKDSIKRSQAYIKEHLSSTPDMQTSFITFCEKVLLIKKVLAASKFSHIDPPVIWLNPTFTAGYSSTGELHRLIVNNRGALPHYLEGITVMAKGYWDFINQPTPLVLMKIHKRLYYHRQYELISLLGHVTLKYILVSKQLI
jgi:hypothetical protein